MLRTCSYEGIFVVFACRRNYRNETIIDTIRLYDINDEHKAPVMLNCSPCLFAYIFDIEGHDDEERYQKGIPAALQYAYKRDFIVFLLIF